MKETNTHLSDDYVNQVRTFSSLGYTPERIAKLINITRKEQAILVLRISLPGDVYHEAYHQGRTIGEYNIDVELAKKAEMGDIDAITLLEERKNNRVELDLRQELFGI